MLSKKWWSLFVLLIACSCVSAKPRPLPNGKVLLDGFPIEAKKRLFAKAGITNFTFCGYGERDSKGDRLCFPVQVNAGGQRQDRLVVVTAEGVHTKPWHIYNEMMTDNEELAVWEEPVKGTNSTWRLPNGKELPKGSRPRSVSGEWIALGTEGHAWLTKLNNTDAVVAELAQDCHQIDIFANEQTVHVFARPGWRNEDGPMKYLVYDFARSPKHLSETTFSWVRVIWDMDPETGIAIVNDNNNFWGRIWLLDLKTGKRKWISADWPSLIVKKEVAQKWNELTKH